MPGLAQRNNDQYSFGFWSKEIDGVSYNQLQKVPYPTLVLLPLIHSLIAV